MKRWPALLLGLGWAIGVSGQAKAPGPRDAIALRPQVEAFVVQMQQEHGFEPGPLRSLLRGLKPNAAVLKAISAPSIARPWYQVRPVLVDPGRVSAGVRFWGDNEAALLRVRETYGVPEAVVTAVIGVETRYGRNTGGFRALDALATLAFDYPPRGDYFREELVQLLLLAREQQRDPAALTGSYAGALGLPQFMPSSYRRVAVDFNDDGRIDLWSDAADAVGSVGAYLKAAGWQPGLAVVLPARLDVSDPQPLLEFGVRSVRSIGAWATLGAHSLDAPPQDLRTALFSVDLLDGPEYWFGTENFQALFHYNHSRNYVMAVNDLAREITRERLRQRAVQ